MKKTILLVAVCAMMIIPAQAKKKKKAVQEEVPVEILLNPVDSMSYALGVNIGGELSNNLQSIPGGEYNLETFLEGFLSAIKNEPTLMEAGFAQEYMQTYMMEAYERETQAKKAEGENFLAQNRLKEGVYETASGLQYIIEIDADGPKPQATDKVKVNYEGFLLNGTKFDSSLDRDTAIEFTLNQVIPGWTEGVQLMSVGAKYKFFVPYELAYGERGAGQTIPPYSTLIFDVELLEINPEN